MHRRAREGWALTRDEDGTRHHVHDSAKAVVEERVRLWQGRRRLFLACIFLDGRTIAQGCRTLGQAQRWCERNLKLKKGRMPR